MSEYPSEWKVLPLGEVAEVVGGGTPSRDTAAFWGDDHYWITPSEVVAIDGKTACRSKERISDLGLASSGAKLHPPGTILMTSRASIGFAAIATEEICTNQGFQSLRCGKELDNWFALHQIRHRRAELQQLAAGSTFLEVSGSNVRSFPFVVPPLPEQKKIAEILSGIDSAVNANQTLLEKSLSMKIALVNDFCSDASGTASKSVLLSEIVEDDAPICYGILMPGSHFQGGVPVIKVKNIVNGVVVQDDILFTDPEIDKKYARSRIAEGDLLVTIRGSTGRTALVPPNLNNANITQDTARVRVRTGVNSDLLRIYLDSSSGQKYIEDHTIGQAVKGINLADLRKMPIPLRIFDSGNKFTEAISSMDSRVTHLRFKVAKLKCYKNAVTSDLLSGRERVSV